MKTLTASAHIEPDTTSRVNVFPSTNDDEAFVSLRIGGDGIDVAFLARAGTAEALRTLARAADEAARVLDQITADEQEGAA
ncbi:hypothetical protein SRB17_28770 [Streptomyces sp. RB17]|uniref:hypothetical protein n=1 Tax=Streptomyces sp. RB17 TaxID=2585197 RepID=UPI00129501C4|nr:hypothetical protein [Streptomyces sp. RB17]MQY34905.1 hypothetical protein [Streptomyces sp. RB17]